MDGSGISEQDGYTEETSVDVCMQLDTADCTKYQVYKLNPRERFLDPPPSHSPSINFVHDLDVNQFKQN